MDRMTWLVAASRELANGPVREEFNKVASISALANEMLPTYEEEVASPYSSMSSAAGLGMLGMAGGKMLGNMAGMGIAKYIPSKYRGMAGMLAGAALPAVAGIINEYTTRDDRAQNELNRDLADVQTDIMTGMHISQLPYDEKLKLLQKAQGIQQYLDTQAEDQGGVLSV